ncbi:hypothetical protein GCM10010869_41100 [Mesorhizobium tianshanense]|nr:hypothetical protein GCM10010869_41100 [Mesorhizobium tianshanense]
MTAILEIHFVPSYSFESGARLDVPQTDRDMLGKARSHPIWTSDASFRVSDL